MNAIERARLKKGKRLLYNNRLYVYQGYRYRAHGIVLEGGTKKVSYPTGFVDSVHIWEELSNEEILNAEIV